jgi:hypothetical protein
MTDVLSLVGSVAVVSFAIGALLSALGRSAPGTRAMAFGIVLMIVGEALARQGAALMSWLQAHAELVGLVFLGAVLLAALVRFAGSSARRGEPKFSKKRRVESGP